MTILEFSFLRIPLRKKVFVICQLTLNIDNFYLNNILKIKSNQFFKTAFLSLFNLSKHQ